jgi:hypothetical protein
MVEWNSVSFSHVVYSSRCFLSEENDGVLCWWDLCILDGCGRL